MPFEAEERNTDNIQFCQVAHLCFHKIQDRNLAHIEQITNRHISSLFIVRDTMRCLRDAVVHRDVCL